MLADGSEYRGDYDPGPAVLADFHRPRIEALVEAGADLLAFETIPTIREAEVLVRLLDEVSIPAWLSFSCRDEATTSAGEPIADAMALGDHPRLVAVGVNCTAPRHLPALLAAAAEATERPRIAYPNGGDRWDATARRWVADGGGALRSCGRGELDGARRDLARWLLRDGTARRSLRSRQRYARCPEGRRRGRHLGAGFEEWVRGASRAAGVGARRPRSVAARRSGWRRGPAPRPASSRSARRWPRHRARSPDPRSRG